MTLLKDFFVLNKFLIKQYLYVWMASSFLMPNDLDIEFVCCQICWESKSIFLHVYRGATCCMYVLGLIQ